MTVSLLVPVYGQAIANSMASVLAWTPGLPTLRWASASPYRLPRNASGQIVNFRTFYNFLGEATTTSQLPSGKPRKVLNFLERNLRTTNAKDEKSRDEVENQVLKSRKEVEDRA